MRLQRSSGTLNVSWLTRSLKDSPSKTTKAFRGGRKILKKIGGLKPSSYRNVAVSRDWRLHTYTSEFQYNATRCCTYNPKNWHGKYFIGRRKHTVQVSVRAQGHDVHNTDCKVSEQTTNAGKALKHRSQPKESEQQSVDKFSFINKYSSVDWYKAGARGKLKTVHNSDTKNRNRVVFFSYWICILDNPLSFSFWKDGIKSLVKNGADSSPPDESEHVNPVVVVFFCSFCVF